MLKEKFFNTALTVTDILMAVIPRAQPADEILKNCKIVSHRGEHDNVMVLENTFAAFDQAAAEGVWGIESDIRWTADLVPVVIHDPDTMRVFGTDLMIRSVTFRELRQALPDIPSLGELVDRYGGKQHLMVELKEEEFPRLERQQEILRDHFSVLQPSVDYHVLALNPQLFETFDIKPKNCCLPVAETNFAELSKSALDNGLRGLTGHFLLLNDQLKQRHQSVGQKFGTGFIRSRNCLFRELNRDIEWIFTNDAVKLQRIVNALVK